MLFSIPLTINKLEGETNFLSSDHDLDTEDES